ncbi:MAG: barstar family protein [Caldilineaceae bacterium]|nr:barstar family protein [Caldilineaceae bacterium]
MNISELILSGARPPGIYRTPQMHPDYVIAPLARQGWRGFFIDGEVVTTKADFLRVASATMDFPAYVRPNWDAFEEAMRDLSWAPATGYLLIYDGVWHLAWNEREAWATAHSILTAVAAFWQTKEIPFYILLSRTWWYARDIEKLA